MNRKERREINKAKKKVLSSLKRIDSPQEMIEAMKRIESSPKYKISGKVNLNVSYKVVKRNDA